MPDIGSLCDNYASALAEALTRTDKAALQKLAEALRSAWKNRNAVYLCGNGGSAGNAIHLANDFIYGVDRKNGSGLRVEALSSNASVITCLANDIGYEEIFAHQLRIKADAGDVLIVLSGSGNSPNVVKALETGNALKMKTFAILGYSGGRCKELAQVPLHFAVDDMQIAEDLQLITGHICMRWLSENPA